MITSPAASIVIVLPPCPFPASVAAPAPAAASVHRIQPIVHRFRVKVFASLSSRRAPADVAPSRHRRRPIPLKDGSTITDSSPKSNPTIPHIDGKMANLRTLSALLLVTLCLAFSGARASDSVLHALRTSRGVRSWPTTDNILIVHDDGVNSGFSWNNLPDAIAYATTVLAAHNTSYWGNLEIIVTPTFQNNGTWLGDANGELKLPAGITIRGLSATLYHASVNIKAHVIADQPWPVARYHAPVYLYDIGILCPGSNPCLTVNFSSSISARQDVVLEGVHLLKEWGSGDVARALNRRCGIRAVNSVFDKKGNADGNTIRLSNGASFFCRDGDIESSAGAAIWIDGTNPGTNSFVRVLTTLTHSLFSSPYLGNRYFIYLAANGYSDISIWTGLFSAQATNGSSYFIFIHPDVDDAFFTVKPDNFILLFGTPPNYVVNGPNKPNIKLLGPNKVDPRGGYSYYTRIGEYIEYDDAPSTRPFFTP